MRIIKTAKQHRPYPKKQALSTLFSKNGCCLSILIFLFQFFPSFFFLQGGSLVWALRFQTAPQAIDDVYEDTTFSPNGDGVQDTLLIGFITDGDLGDFRIIIDTHGPSGVGAPDGHFRIDEDWVITGEVGPGIEEDDAPKAIREAWDGNDFSRQQEDKNPRLLNDGRYRIQIEIDVVPNEEVNLADSGYRAVRLSAIIDNTPPQLSAIASQRDLSPNGDTIIDEAQINYGLSEDLAELELQFTDPSYRPAVPLTQLTEGNHSFTWTGVDGLGTALSDGIYTVQLHGTDKGGNVGIFGIGTIQIDTKPPTIVQLTPNRNSFQNTPVEQIEALFDVDDGSLIDIDSIFTRIILEHADGARINGVPSYDEEVGRVTLMLDQPLDSSDENGVYAINVSGADKAGNIVRDEVNFTFDNIAPTVIGIATDAGRLSPDTSTTTKFTFVDVTLADNIDSRVNSTSTIRLSGLEGAAVAGIQRQFGENGIRWTPGFPLATDGSDDGNYIITVQSRDRAGNEVEIQIPFIYDTQVPELVLTSDSGVQLNLSESAEAFLTTPLSVLTATFNDGNGGGIDFSETSIAMFSFDRVGELQIPVSIQGTLTSDENNDTLEFRLNQPLERGNGSQDGTYLIRVRSTDKAGNAETRTIELVYDTQAPTIVSTIRTVNPLTTQQIEVELEVTDTFAGGQGSGFDASASTFELFDVNGAMVDGAQTNDGAGRFAFRSRVLPEGGMYTLVVTLADRAGNRSIPLPLIYDAEEPTIEAVSHIDPTATVSNVSEFLTRLEATVSDVGTGIDFDRSLIQLLNAAGEVVPGTPYHDDEATIGWELSTPLTREGNFDGLYSLRVSAVDKAGHVEEKTFALRYDTQVPIIQTTLVTKNDGTLIELFAAEAQLITSPINRITVGFSDGEGSGMDVLRTTVSLIGPEGAPVGTNQSDNGVDTVYLSFNPLRADGSDDGFYRVQVTPTDLAGNTLTNPVELPFFYGTRKPEVISTTPAEFASVTHLTEVSAILQDHSGEGIDFDRATILLKSPDQSPIPGHQTMEEAQSLITWELNQPLSRDGSADGEYTIQLSFVDKVGNSADVEHTFVYDTLIPTIISVTGYTNPPTVIPANGLTIIEQLFDGLVIKLSDANGGMTPVSGMDLVGTTVQLLGPENAPVGINARDDGVDTITVSFAPLHQLGTYIVKITPRDLAGNVSRHAIEYKFNLELERSTVSAVIIDGQMAPVEFVNRLDEIVATLEDVSATGLNLTSDGSTIAVTGPDGEVEGVQTSRGENQIAWRPLQLATDGSADGVYTVTVTPVNSGDRLGIPSRHQFTLDTQEPEVALVTPIDLTQPLSYIGQQIIQIAAQVEDLGPAGLEVDNQRLQLRDAGGNVVPAVQTNDGEAQIFLTLSQPLTADGSDDGVYTVSIELTDKAGNLNSLSHQLIYDTLIPTIVSVTGYTNPPTVIPANGLTTIEQLFDGLVIKLSDANGGMTPVSGMDLVGTTVQLLGPENAPVGINTRDDGVDTITVSFAPLHQLGTYIVKITPRDLAGNVSRHAIEYKFNLELERSTVSAVIIDGQMAPVEFVNRLDEIVATLEDVSATGLNLTSDGSTVTVTGPNGEVDGVQTSRGENQIAWRPLQLATDGSADGVYTVTVTPVNSGDRLGIPARYQFTLDTQEPEVVSVTPIDLTQPLSYIGRQLIQIAAQVEDVGPAGLEIEDQRLQLLDAGGNLVPAVQTNDRESQIFLTLSQPLTADGSDDGVYTVNLELMDKAGNLNLLSHQLVYDTQAPTLVSTNPTDGSLRSDNITLITARLNDLGGSGIDFAESTLTLLDLTGTPVSGVQSNDGNRKLTLQISGLVADGNYTIRVEAIDRAGNGSNAPFKTQFTFSSGMPVVVSTVPKTTPAEEAFTNEPLGQVSVELQSEEGGVGRSTIALLAPGGTTVPGQQVRRGKLLIYRLLRELANDGSDDGTYTIVVIPINSAGRQGEPEQFTFVYDTVAAEVIPASIQLIVAEPGVNNSLVSVGALITDDEPSSGVDWDNLDLSWITLDDVTRNRKIDGTLATDAEQALLLNLIMPLASDGSQDGVYLLTIAPKDRAGNVSEAVSYPFFYDTRPPMIDTSSLLIDGQLLLTDSNDPYYPSATNKSGSIIIDAKFSDVNPDGSYGLGPDLVNSSITVRSPAGDVITGTTTQNGTDSIRFKSGPLDEQGHYQVTITSVGLDVVNLGFQPTDSVTTQFLFETTKPVVELTDLVGETTFEDEPLPLQGTARDPSEEDIPASEVALIEVVGTGPDGLPINPVAAKDDSEEEEDPWSRWSIDFLPSQSGEYNLDVRVTDHAGNAGIYDAVTVNFSVSLIFKGPTYVWPNPLSLSRRSNDEVAHFSFEVNVPGGEGARIVLSIYDFAGDLVYEKEYNDLGAGRSDNEVRWDLTNQSGIDVARGIYIFRLEAEDVVTSNRTNAVGKIVVVE